MIFNSLDFLIFAGVVIPTYFLLPFRYRWLLLLGASYFFYSYWRVDYIILILFSTLVDYFAAQRIAALPPTATRGRNLALMSSLAVNLGVLFLFKYFNFFGDSARALAGVFGMEASFTTLNVLLPVGISFYTFQSMAYTIDVYRGKLEPERHLGIFALYVAFFPQLVAGPIERAPNMLPQFRTAFYFDYARTVSGLRLVLWGLFKKVVIADRLGVYVNAVYDAPDQFSGGFLLVATFFFTFQIYCDFSAYSDIAIGVARIMGFDLMQNFRQPYFARSIREFWQRWHISLSTWFRDYVYIPLGGNRAGLARQLRNLMIVFLLSGLWHGANWTFVMWGFVHGAVICLERLAEARGFRLLPRRKGRSAAALYGMLFTFAITMLAWVFFRANSIGDAVYILTHMLRIEPGTDLATPFTGKSTMGPYAEYLLSFALIGLLLVVDGLEARYGLDGLFNRVPRLPRWATYSLLWVAVIVSPLLLVSGLEFIYFQF